VSSLEHILAANRAWAEQTARERPGFFDELAEGQQPRYLWIGCADSRVPASQITGLEPGELFVHRNIANQVIHSDLSALSVLEFAVRVLGVEHVIVCGHKGCGGVAAALADEPVGLVDNWLRHIRDVQRKYRVDEVDPLCELNVIEQVSNVGRTTIVEQAWRDGRPLTVHGWIYDLKTGLLKDLGVSVTRRDRLDKTVDAAAARAT